MRAWKLNNIKIGRLHRAERTEEPKLLGVWLDSHPYEGAACTSTPTLVPLPLTLQSQRRILTLSSLSLCKYYMHKLIFKGKVIRIQVTFYVDRVELTLYHSTMLQHEGMRVSIL